MDKAAQMPPIKILFAVIIVAVIIFGGGQIWASFRNAQIINEKATEISKAVTDLNSYLSELNSKLEQFNNLPNQITDIQGKIASLQTKTDTIVLESAKYNTLNVNFENELKQLEQLKIELQNVHKELAKLQEIYPPVQSQNIIFENVTNEAVNNAISTAINVKSRTISLTFAFGALFGSLVSIPLYFIFKKYVFKIEK